MKLSIIIPTHNRSSDLDKILVSISNQNLNQDFEVIVVANLEDPATEKVIERHEATIKNLVFDVSGVLGVNTARNIGLERCRGEIVLFLDDDVRLHQTDYLSRLVERHAMYPEVCGIGGRYQLCNPATGIELAYHLTCDLWLSQSRLFGQETLNLVGGNASYKRDQIQGKFVFEEEIRFGGAETQFNARLFQAGLKLLLFDDLTIIHDVHLGLRGFLYRAFRQGAARKRILLEGFDSGYRFGHQDLTRSEQLRHFFPALRLRRNTVRFLKLFDYFFALGFDWAEVALFEDSRRIIWLKIVGQRLSHWIRKARRTPLLLDLIQPVQIVWPQRARFYFSSESDN